MQDTDAATLGSTGKISRHGALRGSLDGHKQEDVDEFRALALMRAVEDVKTACLHVDTTERTREASMLRVWLHLPQPFTVPQLCSRPTPSTLSLRLLPVTLLFAVMHALCHRLRWPPRLPHLLNRALSPRSAPTANALRAALLGAPSLARRLRERGRWRARKEVTPLHVARLQASSSQFCHVKCCDVPSSDNDEHNTSNKLPWLCARALVASHGWTCPSVGALGVPLFHLHEAAVEEKLRVKVSAASQGT